MLTIYEVLHNNEDGPIADWRGLIAKLAETIVHGHYEDGSRSRPGPFNRRVLEDILDARTLPIDWNDVQGLSQAATADATTLGSVVGACLALTWPQRPQDLDSWLDRARELTGLAVDEAGIKPGWLAVEISRQGGWGVTR